MYDAYAGLANDKKDFPLYVTAEPPKPIPLNDDTVAAAVGTAAHGTLSELFPSQRPFFDSIFAATAVAIGATADVTAANDYGVMAAKAIWKDREDDPGAGGTYKPMLAPGKHRPDPDNPTQGFHAPEYGSNARGFGIKTRHELAPPPFASAAGKFDPAYLDALDQVRGVGIAPELAGMLPKRFPLRTPDETVTGIYWGYDGALQLGTPPRLYNQIVRAVAIEQKNSVADSARLFAFVNVAMADAGILAWEQKYVHNFWRPVVGIREHDPSLGPDPASTMAANPITDAADTAWLPLGAPNTNRAGSKNFTPNFPAYPSGHATFGAAALHITRLFYKKGGRFDAGKGKPGKDPLFKGFFVSDEYNGINADNRGTVRPKHRRKIRGRPVGHDPRERAQSRLPRRALGLRCLRGEGRPARSGEESGQEVHRRRAARPADRRGRFRLRRHARPETLDGHAVPDAAD